jgi:hypothetical protein
VRADWDGMGNGFAGDVTMKGPGHFRAYFDGGDGFQTVTSAGVYVGR